jgi:hypothetical protein
MAKEQIPAQKARNSPPYRCGNAETIGAGGDYGKIKKRDFPPIKSAAGKPKERCCGSDAADNAKKANQSFKVERLHWLMYYLPRGAIGVGQLANISQADAGTALFVKTRERIQSSRGL